jgi:hypothetical protein
MLHSQLSSTSGLERKEAKGPTLDLTEDEATKFFFVVF